MLFIQLIIQEERDEFQSLKEKVLGLKQSVSRIQLRQKVQEEEVRPPRENKLYVYEIFHRISQG
jgi:hypothetical protein